MTLTIDPEGGQEGKERSAPGGAFALPVTTSFRFALLIAAVVVSSFTIYQAIYLVGPHKAAFLAQSITCHARAFSQPPSGISGYASALHQENVCMSGVERSEAWWGLLGVGLLAVLASVLFLLQPLWYRRRMHLTEPTENDAAALLGRLEGLRRRAGTGPVTWLLQPANAQLSAFAFGRPGHRYVAISGGTAVAAIRRPVTFDAVVFHELAHVQNRDIDQTYLAIAIWRAFVVAALLPMTWVLIFTRELGPPLRSLWRVAVLALIVYLLRNAIVRSREFDADARVRELDKDTQLGSVLAGLPGRPRRRLWRLFWLHPSGRDRAAALLDPEPLFRCGFTDGLAVGLVTAVGATAATQLVALFTAASSLTLLIPAAIVAIFPGAALAVAMWRRRFHPAETAGAKGWTAGLGLGVGLAVGPVIALPTALANGLAPDDVSPSAIGLAAVWVGLVVVVFMSLPVWVGLWADAWQQRAGELAPRVPARAGMLVASLAAWLVMAAGLDLLLTIFNFVETIPAATWHQLPLFLRDAGFDITLQPGAWAAVLAIAAVPIAAPLADRQWWRSSHAHWSATTRQRALAVALLWLGGSVTAVAVMLAASAIAHARIAESVRWNVYFPIHLVAFDQQAVVAIAVAFALIAAARAGSVWSVTAALAVAAAVAAVGAVVLSDIGSIGQCVGSLSIQYARPPPGQCLAGSPTIYLAQTVVGALLVSIMFAPAAYYVGRRLASRRVRREQLPARLSALGWLGIAAVVIAGVAGTALWAPEASAHGLTPLRGIGSDGRIRTVGSDIRLLPGWYTRSASADRRQFEFVFPLAAGRIDLLSLPADPTFIAHYRSELVQVGARPAALAGTRGLRLTRSGLPGHLLELWFVVHGKTEYQITLKGPPNAVGFLRRDFAQTLGTWRWESTPGR